MKNRLQRLYRQDGQLHISNLCCVVGVGLFILVGVVLVPVSLDPDVAHVTGGVIADLGITSSKSALSAYTGDLPSGLPSGGSVGIEGDFAAVSALKNKADAIPKVIQADPVALELIGFGPVQVATPTLKANGISSTGPDDLANEASISTSKTVNPVIRALFTNRPASDSIEVNTPSSTATPPSSADSGPTTAYIATSSTPVLTMFMICPNGKIAVAGGGSTKAASATLVASTTTDATGNAEPNASNARGWTISFSHLGIATLWVICGH